MAQKFFRHALVDLDECLIHAPYITKHVPRRIAAYAVRYLGFDPATASLRCKASYEHHGTNLEGFLAEGYAVNPEHYHAYVHGGLPYHMLEPLLDVRSLLKKWPVDKKYIYTNADRKHAMTTLQYTHLIDCFDGIVCYETLMEKYDGSHGPTPCKPKDISLDLALRVIGSPPKDQVIYFDDSARNVRMGRRAGIESVLVDARGFENYLSKKIPRERL